MKLSLLFVISFGAIVNCANSGSQTRGYGGGGGGSIVVVATGGGGHGGYGGSQGGFGQGTSGFGQGHGGFGQGHGGFGQGHGGFGQGQGGFGQGHGGFGQGQGGFGQGHGGFGSSGLVSGGSFGQVIGGGSGGYGNGNCKYWCKSSHGQYVCCETPQQQQISNNIVSGGSHPGFCPPVRPQCPNVRGGRPRTCYSDNTCGWSEKCCFDQCLGHKVCKSTQQSGSVIQHISSGNHGTVSSPHYGTSGLVQQHVTSVFKPTHGSNSHLGGNNLGHSSSGSFITNSGSTIGNSGHTGSSGSSQFNLAQFQRIKPIKS